MKKFRKMTKKYPEKGQKNLVEIDLHRNNFLFAPSTFSFFPKTPSPRKKKSVMMYVMETGSKVGPYQNAQSASYLPPTLLTYLEWNIDILSVPIQIPYFHWFLDTKEISNISMKSDWKKTMSINFLLYIFSNISFHSV